MPCYNLIIVMAISYQSEDCVFLPGERRKITTWIKEVVASEGYRTSDIAYIFCSPEYHLNINREYLGHDYNTDVITFDYSDLVRSRTVSGDIFIDPYTVLSNAQRIGTSFEEEIMRVIIHGILHLCGHGDKTPEEETEMHGAEDKYLEMYLGEYGKFPAASL